MNGTNLVLSVANTTDSVTIENWNDANYRIEQFLFDADSDGTYETSKGIADIMPLLYPANEGDDVINTTIFPDPFTIDGGEGDDTITTGNANDNVNGSGGNDIITTNGGDDIVYGGGGNDTLSTGSGNDTVYGGDGDDIITDNSGSNTISGGGGNDTITLSGSGGTDLVNGDDGNDTITLSGHNDSIAYGGSGNDLITVTHYLAVQHSYTLSGGTGNDRLVGYQGIDTYIFNVGDGQDVISDNGGTYGMIDTLKFGGISFADLVVTMNGTRFGVERRQHDR